MIPTQQVKHKTSMAKKLAAHSQFLNNAALTLPLVF